MDYTLYQLLWFFLIYAFLGWLMETALAAVRKRRLLNRGFLNAPFSPVYGLAAVLFAIFLPELRSAPFFLFLGGMILATGLELSTGLLLERISHQKWWDYSDEPWNFNGHICLKYSLVWGLLALLCVFFLNPLLVTLTGLLPRSVGKWILLAVLILLGLDFLGSWAALLQLKGSLGEPGQVSRRWKRLSDALDNAVTETIFCRLTTGVWMSRSSVVYGPFSLVWGFGAVLLTAILYQYRSRSDGFIFLFGTVLGGAYEYVCSVFTELVFGTVFWDYSHLPFNLGGRINLLFCFFWGIAAVLWLKLAYPALSRLIERLPMRAGKLLTWGMIVFMVLNAGISSLAMTRYTQRSAGIPAETALEQRLDERFPDARMERIYPNAILVD